MPDYDMARKRASKKLLSILVDLQSIENKFQDLAQDGVDQEDAQEVHRELIPTLSDHLHDMIMMLKSDELDPKEYVDIKHLCENCGSATIEYGWRYLDEHDVLAVRIFCKSCGHEERVSADEFMGELLDSGRYLLERKIGQIERREQVEKEEDESEEEKD